MSTENWRENACMVCDGVVALSVASMLGHWTLAICTDLVYVLSDDPVNTLPLYQGGFLSIIPLLVGLQTKRVIQRGMLG